ncbi:MAG: hypothetical protein JG781_2035 [Peptococcaceae bacterium]|jgi:predicted anti-sigma-YlaC factor YlaD|nr:hypothetical protein [Peptococcaceae bacterium]
MAKNKGCPHPVKLLAWLDGEVEDIHLARHLEECAKCREMTSSLEKENHLLFTALEELEPLPDISEKILARIAERDEDKDFFRFLWYLLLGCSLFVFSLVNYFLPSLINLDSWTIASVQLYSYLTSVIFTAWGLVDYVFTNSFQGGPLLPSFIVILLVSLINYIYKGRFSNA